MFFPRKASLVFCLLLEIAAGAAVPEKALTKHDEELFAWFDKLGIEDFTTKQLVRVRTGAASISGPRNVMQADEPRAFLLWQKGDQFRVLLGDLTAMTLQRHGRGSRDEEYVGFRKITYANEVSALSKILAKNQLDGFWDDGHDSYSDRLKFPEQLFVLARYGAARGQTGLAASVMRRCARALEAKSEGEFDQKLQSEFGSLLAWRATIAFADPGQNRRQLAQLYRTIAEKCPGYGRANQAEEMARTLEAMADEAKAPAGDLAKLSVEEQVRELVFQLRDENTIESDMWHRPWPFEPIPSNGAVARLKALGRPAVPALLAALSDERPSRSVVRNHRYGGGAWVVPIDELACDALFEIAGINFFHLAPYDSNPGSDARQASMREIAAEWWEAVQKSEEIAWLEARVAANKEGADTCLDTLAARFPARFQEMAIKTVEQTKDPLSRSQFLRRLWKLDNAEVNAFFVQEMAHGPALGNRVAAAYPLRQRHHPEAIEAMLKEWGAIGHPWPVEGGDWVRNADSPGHLRAFLLSSNSVQAHQAVMERWPEWGAEVHFGLISNWNSFLRNKGDETTEIAGPRTRSVIEKFLLHLLWDNAATDISCGNVNDVTIAEISASALAEQWPAQFYFKMVPEPKKRAAQLIGVRKTAA